MPLCTPALATLGILTFLGSWNNFLWPLVMAQQPGDVHPARSPSRSTSVRPERHQYGLLLAGSVVVVIPVDRVLPVLQRHIIEGIAMTGLK